MSLKHNRNKSVKIHFKQYLPSLIQKIRHVYKQTACTYCAWLRNWFIAVCQTCSVTSLTHEKSFSFDYFALPLFFRKCICHIKYAPIFSCIRGKTKLQKSFNGKFPNMDKSLQCMPTNVEPYQPQTCRMTFAEYCLSSSALFSITNILFCVDNVRRIYIPINWLGLKLLNTCFRRVYEMKRICLIASAYVRILSVCKLFIFSVYLTNFVCLLLAVCYKSITRPLAAYRETMTYHNLQYAGLWVQFLGGNLSSLTAFADPRIQYGDEYASISMLPV